MKLYLSKHGIAHIELDLDELTELQAALASHIRFSVRGVTKASTIHDRIKALLDHWLELRAPHPRPALSFVGRPPPGTSRFMSPEELEAQGSAEHEALRTHDKRAPMPGTPNPDNPGG